MVLIPCFYCIIKRIRFASPKKDAKPMGGGDTDSGASDSDKSDGKLDSEPADGAPTDVKDNPTELA